MKRLRVSCLDILGPDAPESRLAITLTICTFYTRQDCGGSSGRNVYVLPKASDIKLLSPFVFVCLMGNEG